VFGAITVVPALLAAAWLLPALPLLLAGRLEAPPMVFMFSPLAVGLCYVALHRLPASWPGFRGEHKPVPWWAVAATVAVAAGFAAWQFGARTGQVIVLRDPAAYLQVGDWIARHGSLPIPPEAEAFGGAHPGLTFASTGYAATTAGLVPQLMTGLPLVLAAGIWLGGVPAALVINPLIGACAVLSFGGLAGRLIGARWAPAAAAALALSLPEQYTSRGTFSEPLAQVLLFGGLCLLTDAFLVSHRPPAEDLRTVPADDKPRPHPTPARDQDRVLAALAGLTLGLTVLVRIDGLSAILPAVPFAGLLLAARRRQGIPFGLGLVAGVGYGLADGYLKARPYLDLQTRSVRPLALAVAIVVLLTLGPLAATRIPAASRAAARLARSQMAGQLASWLPIAAATLTLAFLVGFAIRPLARGAVAQDALYWVIWYIGLPAVLLGAFGLAVLASRTTRALLAWNDPPAEARAWALPLLIALWVIVTVLWRPAISADQPWASRRLVPFVLPGLILGAIWASAWLRHLAGQRDQHGPGHLAGQRDQHGPGHLAGQRDQHGPGHLAGQRSQRLTSGLVASCCAASLLIPATMTNLDLGYTSGPGRHLSARGMAFRRIGGGEFKAVNRLCAAIGPDASVVILDPVTADRFAQVVRGLCETPAAVLTDARPATVGAVVAGVTRAGRRPVLLARSGSELAPYGGGPRQVLNLQTTRDARDLTAPPTRTGLVRYTAWLSDPAAAPPS
jgi:hypothetical protein